MPGEDTITLEEYEKLTDAFMKHNTIGEAARESGVGPTTARRYIKKGTKKFPAIEMRVATLTAHALRQSDEQQVRHIQHFKGAFLALANQLRVLKDISLRPAGKELDDGRIQVDEQTFGRLSRATKDLYELGNDVFRAERGEPDPSQVNVNINLPGERARAFLDRHGETVARIQGTDREESAADAIVAAARLRARVQAEQADAG